MFSRDTSPSGDDYYGTHSSRRGAEAFTRSDRLLIAVPQRRDTNNHDFTCYTCAMMFLVFLVVCMVLLAMQGRLQGRLQGVVQDADPAASPLPPDASPGHDGALKSQARLHERSHQMPGKAATPRQRPVKLDTNDIQRQTTVVAHLHSNAPEWSTPPSLRTAITAEADNGGDAASPTPSLAPSGEKLPSGSEKYETHSAEAISTPSNNENRRVTNDSVVRLHPLPIDTLPGDGDWDDDEGYVEGERVANDDSDHRV